MSYLRHIIACNTHDISAFAPFFIGPEPVGLIRKDHLGTLKAFSSVFAKIDEDGVILSDTLRSPDERTAALQRCLPDFVQAGLMRTVRNELQTVSIGWGQSPLMLLDRGAMAFFGIRSYGVHLNGLVESDGTLKMWVGRRSLDKAIAPGKLDNVVAGGLPAGLSLRENLFKEGWEEAGFSRELLEKAKSTGTVSYVLDTPWGLRRDTLFIHDLIIPPSVTPESMDGEMESFQLQDVDEVLRIVRETDDFKFNVALVLVHFGLRHGYIDPDTQSDYDKLVSGLNSL